MWSSLAHLRTGFCTNLRVMRHKNNRSVLFQMESLSDAFASMICGRDAQCVCSETGSILLLYLRLLQYLLMEDA